jgi:hypothetical protein
MTRKNAGAEYRKTAESKLNDAKDSGFIIQENCQERSVCKKNLFKNARFVIVPFKELVGFPPTRSTAQYLTSFSCGLDDQIPDDWGQDPEEEGGTQVRHEGQLCEDESEEEWGGGGGGNLHSLYVSLLVMMFRWEKLKKVPHMAKGRVQRKLNF